MHPVPHASFLFLSALAGGTLNSVAGGGGFICFPALLFSGVPPINANATNTIALWPGTVASTGAYRQELAAQSREVLGSLVMASLLGGLAGAILLLHTPQGTFLKLVPWMLTSATLLFVFGGHLTARLRRRKTEVEGDNRPVSASIALLQLVVAVYIGYFGAGAGIIILALLALMGMDNIHSMNGVKTLLASTANAVALLAFIYARTVYWPEALIMLGGAVLGGYGGAWYARRLDPKLVRNCVITLGSLMSAYFFWKLY